MIPELNLSPQERDMMEGYFDGLEDVRPDLPCHATNRSHSYRHGWLNGRDDRIRQPRASAQTLREEADRSIAADIAAAGDAHD